MLARSEKIFKKEELIQKVKLLIQCAPITSKKDQNNIEFSEIFKKNFKKEGYESKFKI